MKHILILVLTVFMVTHVEASSFDYHGISSGMTSEEVQSLLPCGGSCDLLLDDADKAAGHTFFGGEDKVPPALAGISFDYTSEGGLWRISLKFMERGGASGVAQTRILTELYPDAELQKKSEKLYSSYFDYVYALLIDSDLFAADVQKIYEDQKPKY
jgi:hypothetical protein